MKLKAWRTTEGSPERLFRSDIPLEKHLEEWIANDPSMVGEGLRIIARQLTLRHGGRLDLLAVDPRGQLVLIEVKRGALEEAVVTQALAYSASIATSTKEDLLHRINQNCQSQNLEVPDDLEAILENETGVKEVLTIVAGCGFGLGTETLLDYLSGEYKLPIRAVSFEVFGAGNRPILVREVAEKEYTDEKAVSRYSMEEVARRAAATGVGSQFQFLTEAVQSHSGLYARPYAQCIMCAPAQNKSRCLIAYWAKKNKNGEMSVWVVPEVFEEFFDVSASRVEELLGTKQLWLDDSSAQKFVENLGVLMHEIQGESDGARVGPEE